VTERVDARKRPIAGIRVLSVLRGVDHLYATKGRDIIHLDLRTRRPDRVTLQALVLGPTGNLRAPTIRRGRTLIVGFDEDTYARLLK
jgi:arsenate reductase-like glutaredoxin family protein